MKIGAAFPVAEIGIDPNTARGPITFYELPVLSLMGVRGRESNPHEPKAQGILRRREDGSEQRA
jgi:hypothetical protein